MRILRTGCALALLLAIGCGDDGDNSKCDPGAKCGVQPPPGDAGADAGGELDFTEVDSLVEAFLTEKGLPGATGVILHKEHGNVHERGYAGFDKSRLSVIASSSKILSVGVLAALSDAKQLDLDAPVSTYFAESGMFKTNITTAMLVSNSAGMLSLTDNPLYGPYICQYIDTGALLDCGKTIYTAMDDADRVPPDTKFRYGGGQWQLAGAVAEKVSGKSWADLIKQTYVEPCGASSLGYSNHYSKANAEGDGLGYPKFFMANVANLPVTANPSIEGGAYVTAGDYGKILLMHLRKGLCGDKRVLSEAAVERMQKDRILSYGATTSPDLAGYGLGWWVDRAHPGVVVDPGAYGAIAWIDNEREYAAFFVLEATSDLGQALRTRLLPELEEIFAAHGH